MTPFTAARPYEIKVTTEVFATLGYTGAALRQLHDNERIDDRTIKLYQGFVRELIAAHPKEVHPVGLIEVALGADTYAGTFELDPVSVNEYVRQMELIQSEYPLFANPFAHMVEILTEWGGQPVAEE